jgi:hypothetical protein
MSKRSTRVLRQSSGGVIVGGLLGLLLSGILPTVGQAGGGVRRSLLYPRPSAQLRFDHKKHAQLPCARCHGKVEQSVSANDRHVPPERACIGCHGDKTRKKSELGKRLLVDAKRAEKCAYCHTGYRGGSAPARLSLPKARVRFPHRLHLSKGVACKSCHRFDKPGREMPSMKRCTSCHKKQKASLRCSSCHLTQKDGRLVTTFGSRKLRPGPALAHIAHPAGFKTKHKVAARQHQKLCQSCHQKKQCMRCHMGRFKPMRFHRGDYITSHSTDARLNKPRCSSCHRSQTFCLSCHQRSGVSRSSKRGGFRPSTGLSFHPPGFASFKVGPRHHSFAARRNMRSCSSCHTEKSCIRCHSTTAKRGGGFSPHGRGFKNSAKCRSLRARNPRACRKCHVGGDPKAICR